MTQSPRCWLCFVVVFFFVAVMAQRCCPALAPSVTNCQRRPNSLLDKHQSFSFGGIVSYNNHWNPQLPASTTFFIHFEAKVFRRATWVTRAAIQLHFMGKGVGGCVFSFSRRFLVFVGVTTHLKFCTIWCFLLLTVEAVGFLSHDPTTPASSSANMFVYFFCLFFVVLAETSSLLRSIEFFFVRVNLFVEISNECMCEDYCM